MSSPADLRATEAFFHAQIPLTAAMGVRVAAYDGAELILTAPLEPNHNHLGTAFGGSLAAIATLAGYGFLWLTLGDRAAHLVVQSSALNYRRPVRGEIRAICRRPPEAELIAFQAAFAQKAKARIQLRVTIEENATVALEYTGTFVATR